MVPDSESEKHWLSENIKLLLAQGVLAAGFFALDLYMELGVAGGVPYICLVLVALWSKKKRLIWIAAVVGSLLTLIGFWLSPVGGEDWKVLTNRFLALFAIWVTAFIGYLFKKNEIALQQINEKLEAKVDTRTYQLKSTNEYLKQEVENNIKAKEKLEQLYAQNSTLLETAGVGIFGLDREGRTTFCNPSGAAMVGFTAKEQIGEIQHNLIHHSHSDGSCYKLEHCPINKTLVNGASYRISEDVFWKKDGSFFPVEYISSAVFERQEIVGVVVTFKDISLQKHLAEEKDILLNDLQRMNDELRGFAHIVSHDLKEPLRGITYNAKWLVEDFGGKLGDEGEKMVGLLIQNTQRMHNLINGILEFAELGRTESKPIVLHSGAVAETVIKYLTREPGIKIKVEEPMPKLAYHNIQLEQIFQNLIGNAIRHLGKPEGEIVVSCSDESDFWCFKVWDNGKGIENRHFERIFAMFQSLDRNNNPESTGIGLTLVKKIVEQNGGRVWVESEVGKYSCFKFTVPKITI
ncbi:MAG: PAS domain-containing protein [Nitrospinae bacterium]|nr:PAS domain-containing protein [Nitrospinota bacterium]